MEFYSAIYFSFILYIVCILCHYIEFETLQLLHPLIMTGLQLILRFYSEETFDVN